MHLILVTHNIYKGDGQGRVIYELARRALTSGAAVTLAADRVAPELLDLGAAWLKIQPRYRRPNLLKVREFVARANRVLRGAAERSVVHGHGYTLTLPHQINTAHMVHAAWRRSRDHTSRTEEGLRRWYHTLYSRLNARWEAQAFGAAERVVAVSSLVAGQLRDSGVEPGKICTVGNGVEPDEFAGAPAPRTELGLPSGAPLALFAGDIRIALKNLETILRALTRVPGLHLAVAGDPRESPYPRLARELGLAERVHFLGFREDLPALMRAADFFVLPSRYESFSLVLLEAMAASLPVITARTVGAAELVTSACGYVLDDPNDAASLATFMQTLAGSGSLRLAMGKAAREIAMAHTWQHMTSQYLALYAEAEAAL